MLIDVSRISRLARRFWPAGFPSSAGAKYQLPMTVVPGIGTAVASSAFSGGAVAESLKVDAAVASLVAIDSAVMTHGPPQ